MLPFSKTIESIFKAKLLTIMLACAILAIVVVIILITAISLLTGGLAPANPRCTSQCCIEATMLGAHKRVKVPPPDLVADCCSGFETAPCPRTLESSSEFKDYAPSAVAPDLRPATVTIASSSDKRCILPQFRPLLAATGSPQIRGPSLPIYLLTETFLI